MKKSLIIVLLLILSSTFLVSAQNYQDSVENCKNRSRYDCNVTWNTEAECLRIKETECLEQVARTIDFRVCEEIEYQANKDFCYMTSAVKYKQPLACEEVIDKNSKKWCHVNAPLTLKNNYGKSTISIIIFMLLLTAVLFFVIYKVEMPSYMKGGLFGFTLGVIFYLVGYIPLTKIFGGQPLTRILFLGPLFVLLILLGRAYLESTAVKVGVGYDYLWDVSYGITPFLYITISLALIGALYKSNLSKLAKYGIITTYIIILSISFLYFLLVEAFTNFS